MSIGKNIKDLREHYQLTQAEFGEIAGVSDKAVSTWESGMATPRIMAVQKIADHFNIEKSDLLKSNKDFNSVLDPEVEPVDVCDILQDLILSLHDNEIETVFKGHKIDEVTRQLLIQQIDNAISICNINIFTK